MLDSLLNGDAATAPTPLPTLALTLLLAFTLGHAIAWIYMISHRGVSYSRAFVVALLVLPVVVALVMMVLSNSFVTAFGLMAVFAIVRFRNILRDTLDTVYVLTTIVLGMACGTQKFTTALVGAALLGLIFCYVWLSAFGSRLRHDFIVNLQWTRPETELPELHGVLARHSRRADCRVRRPTPDGGPVAFSFHLLLRDPERVAEMLRELNGLAGVAQLSGLPAADESEV